MLVSVGGLPYREHTPANLGTQPHKMTTNLVQSFAQKQKAPGGDQEPKTLVFGCS